MSLSGQNVHISVLDSAATPIVKILQILPITELQSDRSAFFTSFLRVGPWDFSPYLYHPFGVISSDVTIRVMFQMSHSTQRRIEKETDPALTLPHLQTVFAFWACGIVMAAASLMTVERKCAPKRTGVEPI